MLALPVVRIAEGVVRFVFMRDFYGSIYSALVKDIWFSEGWFSYIKSPVGVMFSTIYAGLIATAVYLLYYGGEQDEEEI